MIFVEMGDRFAGGAGIGRDVNACIAVILMLAELEFDEFVKLYIAEGDEDCDCEDHSEYLKANKIKNKIQRAYLEAFV
jgi:hypothetical protein